MGEKIYKCTACDGVVARNECGNWECRNCEHNFMDDELGPVDTFYFLEEIPEDVDG